MIKHLSRVTLAVVALSAAASIASPLQNGGFQDPVVLSGGSVFNDGDFLAGGLSGWQVVGGEVHLMTAADLHGIDGLDVHWLDSQSLDPSAGGQWLDLTGNSSFGYGKGVEQTFDGLVAGQTYSLSFDLARIDAPAFGPSAHVDVKLNGATATFSNLDPDTAVSSRQNVWTTHSLTFTAQAVNTVQVLGSAGPALDGSAWSIGIDNFNVSAIPEPGAYSMTLAGLGVLLTLARRRRPE